MTTINDAVISEAVGLLQSMPNGVRKVDLMSILRIQGERSQEDLWHALLDRDDIKRTSDGRGVVLQCKKVILGDVSVSAVVTHAWEDEADSPDAKTYPRVRARILQSLQGGVLLSYKALKGRCEQRVPFDQILEALIAEERVMIVTRNGNTLYKAGPNYSAGN